MAGVAPNLPLGTLNVALSNYMKEFRNNAFVGDLLAPRVPVDRQSFQYIVFDRSNQRLDRSVLRAPGDTPQEDRFTYSALPYFCQSHALRAKIPFETEEYSLGLGFSTRQKATGRLTDKLNLTREAYIANLIYTGATNQIALSGTAMFDSYLTGGTSQPIEVVEAAKAQVRQAGVMPNACIIPDAVFVALQSNPTILARTIYKDSVGTAITLDILSTLFGIKCYLASAISLDKNNNASWIWGENMIVCYVQDATSMQDISALKTFVWTAADATVDGYGVLEFPDPDLDAKSTIVSADWYWDTRITANETLVVISNCCAAPTMDAIAVPPIGD
jgi:hypothetical protein